MRLRPHIFALSCSCSVFVGCLPTGWTCEDTLTCAWMGSAPADAEASVADASDAGTRESSIIDRDASIERTIDTGLRDDSDAPEVGVSIDADGGGDADGMSHCDLSNTPAEAPCTIDERFAIFVAPIQMGSVADGSRAHPFTGLADAFQLAMNTGRKRIYLCDDGTGYTDSVTVGSALDGLKVFGGFECSGWTYQQDRRAKLTGSASPALTITKVPTRVLFMDFEIVAPDATTPGASSIAIVVNESAGVVLRRVKATAGKGKDGTNGDNGGGLSNETAMTGTSGNNGVRACTSDPRGGFPATTMCNGVATSPGGSGGDGAFSTASGGGSGNVGSPTSTTTGKAGTGEPTDSTPWSCSNGNGQAGANGTEGSPGRNAAGLGTLTSSGWSADPAGDGTPGQPGQGGGGGGGAKAPLACTAADGGTLSATGASGGSGGGGGCGGHAGKGGMAGGSSVALVSITSGVTLESCDFVASVAGNGGNGGNGQGGGVGGAPGSGGVGAGNPQSNPGCAGGQGGKGGNGGPGGGGAGGHSIGVAYRGTPPVGLDLSTVRVEANGTGGRPGAGSTGKGADGTVAPAQSFDIPDAG